MAAPSKKTLLILDTGSPFCSLAADRFNSIAGMMGLPWEAVAKSIGLVGVENLQAAGRALALSQASDQPVCEERIGEMAKAVEYWQIGPKDQGQIDQQVMDLVARLLGGGERPAGEKKKAPTTPPVKEPAKKAIVLKVGRETAGRHGKGVTTVFDTPLSETALKELGATLKSRCGTGGTVKDGRIEIQGDNRERVILELTKLGYQVKRVGG